MQVVTNKKSRQDVRQRVAHGRGGMLEQLEHLWGKQAEGTDQSTEGLQGGLDGGCPSLATEEKEGCPEAHHTYRVAHNHQRKIDGPLPCGTPPVPTPPPRDSQESLWDS